MSSVNLIGPRQYEVFGPITRGDLNLTEYHSIFNPDVVWSGEAVKVDNVNVSFWQAPLPPLFHKPIVPIVPPPVHHCVIEQPHEPITPTPVPEPVQTGCMVLAFVLMAVVRRCWS